MQKQVHSVHFDADSKLVEFVNSRLDKLSQFHDSITSGEVFLRLEKADDRQNKVSEIRISVPGKDLFAKKQSATFEEATDIAIDALRKQIDKYRSKQGMR